MKWKRQPQERNDQKYFFTGRAFMTRGVRELLTDEEAIEIITELQRLAKEKNGLDYLQSFQNEKGVKIWVIDQLDTNMKPHHPKEHDYFTLLLPSEY